METVKIERVTEWLPIEYENGEPYVSHNGNKLWIRDYIRFEDAESHRTIDFGEYTKSDRFPRFIEVGIDGKEMRLWKVITDFDPDSFRKTEIAKVETNEEVISALKGNGITTVGELLDTSRETLRNTYGENKELLNNILFTLGNMESVMRR